jgi:flavorubredoxin
VIPGGFTFNQYLIVDDEPLLFHTGLRRMFPLVREAVGAVMPVDRLRYISFSHYEADECGALNEFLSVAPQAVPLCGEIAALVSINDVADRPARALKKNCRSANIGCAGSRRHISLMPGSAAFSRRKRRGRCYAVIFSRKAGQSIHR